MATTKKGNKAVGKTTVSKIARKGKPPTGNKTNTSKGVTKTKIAKAKKSATSKKSRTTPTKSAAGNKPTSPASSKKKTTTKKTTVSPIKVKKKKTKLSKSKGEKKVSVSKGKAKKKKIPSKPLLAKKTITQREKVPLKMKSSPKGMSQLSPQERYNVGGLCACVIETYTQDGQDRLQRVLKHLGLSDMDQANLFRVSQGLRIPKLFADGLTSEETRRNVLQMLSRFAKEDDGSGQHWKTDLEDLTRLLGV